MCGTRLRGASWEKLLTVGRVTVAGRGSLYSAASGERSGPWSKLMPLGYCPRPRERPRVPTRRKPAKRAERGALPVSRASLHSLAAAADRECYTFLRRFSAMIGRLTNRHSTRRRSTCRRFSVSWNNTRSLQTLPPLAFRPGEAVVAGGEAACCPPGLRGEGAEEAAFVRPMRPPTRARSSSQG